MTPLFSRLLVTGAALASTMAAVAAEPAIIAKARASLGTEAALNAVKSVHFVGTLVTADPADASKQTRAAVEIFFQAPEKQRIQATSDEGDFASTAGSRSVPDIHFYDISCVAATASP